MKRAAALLLAALILCLPVHSDGEVPAPEEFVPEIMSAHGLREGNYAVAFKSLYDGETWMCNAEDYFLVASVYKLPLNLYYYELENAGELAPDELIGGYALDFCHTESLEHSNNPISQMMYNRLGGYASFKRLILPYTGYSEPELEPDYYNKNSFTARMVLNILDYVWENQDELGGLIGHMLNAQPDDFLNSGGLGCPIAQKYGYETYSGTLHVAVAGIVYAGEPFLIAVLTRGSYAAVSAMGELADAFAEWNGARVSAARAEAEAAAERLDAELAAQEEARRASAAAGAARALAAAPLPVSLPWDAILAPEGKN